MAEQVIEKQPRKFTNPDGKRHPVLYSFIAMENATQIRKVAQIVNSQDETLPYLAINPQTQQEVKLETTQWDLVYRSLLNRIPPSDLDRRVKEHNQKSGLIHFLPTKT